MRFKEYEIRPISYDDLRMILDWRNSDDVHCMMLTEHKITWEEHIRWFERIQREGVCRNFIFEYRNRPIGYIGYTNYDEESMTCAPGAYIGNCAQACIHSALYLMFMAVEYAFSALKMEQLETVVLAENKRALGIDRFIGYKVVGDYKEFFTGNRKGQKAVIIRLNKDEWIVKRVSLMKYIG